MIAGNGIVGRGKHRVIIDSFNRANNASSMGNTETGDAWVTTEVWGIDSNKAYAPNAAVFTTSRILTGSSNVNISASIPNLGTTGNASLIFRYVDSSNYYTFRGIIGTGYRLSYATTSIQTISQTVNAGDTLRAIVSGDYIKCYVNDILIIEYSTALLAQTGFYHGIGTNNGGFRFDNFRCELF